MPGRLPSGTKHELLEILVKQELSAQDLAERLVVSPTAVRQHLATLEALGLVTRRKLVTRPSRPTYLYRLSPKGREAFPKRYDLLLGDLVGVLLERYGTEGVDDIVRAAAARLAHRVRPRFDQDSPKERWGRLLDWIEEELAWQADVTEQPAGHRVTIHHCPFQDVSRSHPAICSVFFATLIRALYGDVPVAASPTPTPSACCAFLVGAATAAGHR